MGVSILVLGEMGSGKSRAIKNLPPETTFVIRPNRKDLPFAGSVNMYTEGKNMITMSSFSEVGRMLKDLNSGKKFSCVIVEDFTHFVSSRVMGDAQIKGFDKWTDLAVDVFSNIIKPGNSMRDDLDLIVIGHTMSSDTVSGSEVITLQTPGKLLDQKIRIPSYFTYVLHTVVKVEDDKPTYKFLTNYDGIHIAKSPEGCLEMLEDNDYNVILKKIKEYRSKK